MPGLAGYLATVKRSGTPTLFSSEAMNTDGSTVANRFQIADGVKEIWDRTVVPTLRQAGSSVSGGTTISSTNIIKIDYLFGRVTFGTTLAPDVRVAGTFMPVAKIIGAKEYTMAQVGDGLDNTEFDSTSLGIRTRQVGLLDVNITIAKWEPVSIVLDSFNDLNAQRSVVIEIQPGGVSSSGPIARGWFIPENASRSGDMASLEQGDLSFQLDGDARAAFSWSDL